MRFFQRIFHIKEIKLLLIITKNIFYTYKQKEKLVNFINEKHTEN